MIWQASLVTRKSLFAVTYFLFTALTGDLTLNHMFAGQCDYIDISFHLKSLLTVTQYLFTALGDLHNHTFTPRCHYTSISFRSKSLLAFSCGSSITQSHPSTTQALSTQLHMARHTQWRYSVNFVRWRQCWFLGLAGPWVLHIQDPADLLEILKQGMTQKVPVSILQIKYKISNEKFFWDYYSKKHL